MGLSTRVLSVLLYGSEYKSALCAIVWVRVQECSLCYCMGPSTRVLSVLEYGSEYKYALCVLVWV